MRHLADSQGRKELLLHLCCAPDATHGVAAFGERFDVIGFFYNPNIQPREEFRKRLSAALDLQESARSR